MEFSALKDQDFIGRQGLVASLVERLLLAQGGAARSAMLTGPRGMGSTEVLKQLFNRLYWKPDGVAPFFYTVSPAVLSAQAFSRNYLTQFLCQRIAYEKKEQALLYLDGVSIADVSLLMEERGEAWACEILNRYQRCSGDPLDAMRIALNAPFQSAVATGTPVAVFVDEFQRLKDVRRGEAPDPCLAALFEEPFSSGKTPHIISGNSPELQEMSVSSSLERIVLFPLELEDMASRAHALLSTRGIEGTLPRLLLRHLGGNPKYLGCVARAIPATNRLEERACWSAYIREIREGCLAASSTAVLKHFFPQLELRQHALEVASMISRATEPLSCKRIARSLKLPDDHAQVITKALYLAGFIRGEFGVLRAGEDRVERDIIECLHLREIHAQSAQQLEQHFLNALLPRQEEHVHFDMTIPMVSESELVVAQGLEQIGKNLQLDEDVIGQMQIAVIEACINAMEHGKGAGDTVRIALDVDGNRLRIEIESAGPEFILQETGEPFSSQAAATSPNRGWGIKLMKRFADEVIFERITGGTRTVLIKKLGSSAVIQKEDTTHHE